MLSRDEVIETIEKLKKEMKTWQRVLQVLDRSNMEKRTGSAMRFYQVRPGIAIKMVLREKGPLTQEAIIQELVDGGNTVGKKRDGDKPHNVRLSIEKTLKTGSLVKVGDLIGLPEWPAEKFKP